MKKPRPRLTKKQKEEYAKVPITKEDEAKLAAFLRVKPKGKPVQVECTWCGGKGKGTKTFYGSAPGVTVACDACGGKGKVLVRPGRDGKPVPCSCIKERDRLFHEECHGTGWAGRNGGEEE